MRSHMAIRLFALFLITCSLASCSGLRVGDLDASNTQITRKKIDFNNIGWFARRAQAAYLREGEIKTKYPKTVRVSTPKGSDVQYFLERFPKTKKQVISIRGTSNLKNMIEDVEYAEVHDNKIGIDVHKGFHGVALKLYKDIRPHLKKDYTVAATGHSLGAASSVILLMYLKKDGFTIAPSFNFGQPKVTNSAGAKRYSNLPVTRVIDENDAVTMFPLSVVLNAVSYAYEHIGAEIILLKSEHFVFLDQHAASRISVEEFQHNFARAFLKDHAISKYIRKIMNLETEAIQVSYANREKFAE